MPDQTTSASGVECPHRHRDDEDDLAALIPGTPVEWDCRFCGKPMTVTKIVVVTYVAEKVER